MWVGYSREGCPSSSPFPLALDDLADLYLQRVVHDPPQLIERAGKGVPGAHQRGDRAADARGGERCAGPARQAVVVRAAVGERADIGADDAVGLVAIDALRVAAEGDDAVA